MNQLDISTLSKDELMSEMNALNYLANWTLENIQHCNKLNDEYHKRIDEECKLSTQGGI